MEKGISTLNEVPLPDELPKLVDLRFSPSKSEALNSLLSQNEDLAARLRVSLGRISDLEERLDSETSRSEILERDLGHLKDQLLLLREKSRLVQERREKSHADYSRLTAQIQLLEIQYAELYTTSVSHREKMELENRRLKKYRFKIKALLSKTVRDLKQNKLSLSRRVACLQDELASTNAKILESAQYIAERQNVHKEVIQSLQNSHQAEAESLRRALSGLEEKYQSLSAEHETAKTTREELIRVRNENVLIARQKEEFLAKTNQEIETLQSDLFSYRTEAKNLRVENDRLNEECCGLKASLDLEKDQAKKFQDQIESLRILWREQQEKLERQNEKCEALQKLNQQMSSNLLRYQSKIRALSEKVDAGQIRTEVANPQEPEVLTPELITRFDHLIAEIQSGISK